MCFLLRQSEVKCNFKFGIFFNLRVLKLNLYDFYRVVRSLPYEPGTISSKHMAWALHAGIIGAFLAPLTMLGI